MKALFLSVGFLFLDHFDQKKTFGICFMKHDLDSLVIVQLEQSQVIKKLLLSQVDDTRDNVTFQILYSSNLMQRN
jgi:hypothetical protein